MISRGPKIITNGLVLNLDAANRKSYSSPLNTWTNIAQNNVIFTPGNTPTYNSSNLGNILLDGDDYFIGKGPKPTNSMTIMAYIKPSDISGSWKKILVFPYGVSSWTSPFSSYQIGIYTGKPFVGFNVNSDWPNNYVTGPNNLSVGQWVHLCGTFLNGVMNLYVNGISVASKNRSSAGTSIVYTARENLVIGLNAEYLLLESYDGNVASIQMYNRALSLDEVKQNFNVTRSRFNI